MEKFPPILGIPCDNLHSLVGDALPSNGEWHTLTACVRKTEDGVFQVDELLLRLGIDQIKAKPNAKYPNR